MQRPAKGEYSLISLTVDQLQFAHHGVGDLLHASGSGVASLVVGGEDSGVKRLTKEKCDGIVSIPMYGKVNSLNVSTAAAVILAEASKQHRQKK